MKMNANFARIKEQLDDPFFELNNLGKEAIRYRTLPVNKYAGAPDNLLFVGWVPEDDHVLITYSFRDTRIGRVLLGSTPKGLCFLGFADQDEAGIKADFMRRFPKHPMGEEISSFQMLAVEYCDGNHELTIPLHLKGTGFQLGIWKQLVRIPRGRLSTYGSLTPNAGGAQAIGSAVGSNPVSYIVPCHRIVKSDGCLEGYHWGTEIKKQLLAYEFQCCGKL